MFCKNCGSENNDTDKFCKNCGQPLSAQESQQEQASGSAAPDPTPVQYTSYQQESPMDESAPTGIAIASMVLGIVSIVFCCFSVIAVACGVIAIVFAKKEEQRGVSNGFIKAGFICGLIGSILAGLYLIYWIFAIVVGIGSASTIPFRHF